VSKTVQSAAVARPDRTTPSGTAVLRQSAGGHSPRSRSLGSHSPRRAGSPGRGWRRRAAGCQSAPLELRPDLQRAERVSSCSTMSPPARARVRSRARPQGSRATFVQPKRRQLRCQAPEGRGLRPHRDRSQMPALKLLASRRCEAAEVERAIAPTADCPSHMVQGLWAFIRQGVRKVQETHQIPGTGAGRRVKIGGGSFLGWFQARPGNCASSYA
jgi:hypothetical protein